MKVLIVSAVFPPAWRYGGPPMTSFGLARALKRHGVDVFVLSTGDLDTDGSPVLDKETEWGGVPVMYCSRKVSPIPFYSPSLKRQVAQRVADYDVAIIRSSWTYVGPAASKECREKGVPYLAYPEGTFDPWALRRSKFKKLVFWHLWDRSYFSRAAAIVALTKSEADNIRRMGLTNRVEVIPNGVDVSDFECGLTREELEFMFPKIKGRTLVLFLGRIHPKKGLLNLVIAFKKVRSLYPDAILLIAGPDERGHKREVEECVRQEGLNEDVLFLGPVSGELKVGLLKNSDVFVLPSYSEGFAVAVLEALACKLPVVLTKYCNVPEVAEAGAGIEVDISPYQIANAIIILLSDHKMRKQMGENGYRLVLERFNWDRVAKTTINLCSEVIR